MMWMSVKCCVSCVNSAWALWMLCYVTEGGKNL